MRLATAMPVNKFHQRSKSQIKSLAVAKYLSTRPALQPICSSKVFSLYQRRISSGVTFASFRQKRGINNRDMDI